MTELLYNLGIKRNITYNLEEKRIFLNLLDYYENTYLENLSYEEIINKLEELISNKININNYTKEWKFKENSKGFSMKWHCDDCFIRKNKKNYLENMILDDDYYIRNEKLDDIGQYTLTHTEKLPEYTVLIYFSDYNKDYKGAELHFVNKIITPNKYDVIIFDSREIHKVNIQTNGIRKNLIIKYYKR